MTKNEYRKHVQQVLADSGVAIERAASGAWVLSKADRRVVIADIGDLPERDIARLAGERPNHAGYRPGDCIC